MFIGSLPRRILNFFLILLILFLSVLLIVGISLCIYAASITEREIDGEVFEVLSNSTASKIYYYQSESDREAA